MTNNFNDAVKKLQAAKNLNGKEGVLTSTSKRLARSLSTSNNAINV